MTIGRVSVLLLSASVWSGPVVSNAAAQQAPAAVGANDEVEHEALRQIRALYEGAIRDNRVESLGPVLRDDFYGVMVTGRVVKGLDELRRYWTDIHALMGDGGRYTTTLNPELSVLIGDIALARGTSDDVVTTSEGQEFRFTTMWTAVLQKQDGSWKLRQAQGSMDPVDNAFVREFARRALIWAAALSGIVGALLGAGITWLRMRRRSASA